jgi:RHS repeat-associated protein
VDRTAPEVHWLLTDHLNSVRLVLDESGALLDQIAYDAFGTIVAQLNPLLANPILFASREFDAETGLYYNRARYLDPSTGRWTTQDPLGFAAGDANLYRYVGNMATMATDPSGLILYDWLADRIVNNAPASWVEAWAGPSVRSEPPSFGVSLIPIYGAANQAEYHLSRGEYGWAAGYTLMAATDVFLVRSLLSGLGRVGWRSVVSRPGTMEVVVSEGRPFHVFWKAGGTYYEARGSQLGSMKVLGADSQRAIELFELWERAYVRRRFWVLNPALAGEARHGQHAFSCMTAAFTAWGKW